jgi:hypothetical protein
MSDLEDEDIRRAIALSLQDDALMRTNVIELVSSEDEDDDLEAPVHTRRKQATENQAARGSMLVEPREIAIVIKKEVTDRMVDHRLPSIEPQNLPEIANKTTSVGSAMLGLDRAQMEAERLARVRLKQTRDEETRSELDGSKELIDSKKRKAPVSDPVPESQDARQVRAKYSTASPLIADDIAGPDLTSSSAFMLQDLTRCAPETQSSRSHPLREPISGKAKSRSSKALPLRTSSDTSSRGHQQTLQGSGVQYLDGIVKKTWVRGCPMESDVIKIEEVFQKETLKLAVLSAFQVDPDWVSSKLLEETKVIWVLGARDEEEVGTRCSFRSKSRSLFSYSYLSSTFLRTLLFILLLSGLW